MFVVISVLLPFAIVELCYYTYLVWPFIVKRVPLGRFRSIVVIAYASAASAALLNRPGEWIMLLGKPDGTAHISQCPWLIVHIVAAGLETATLALCNLEVLRVSAVIARGRSLAARRSYFWKCLLLLFACGPFVRQLSVVASVVDMPGSCSDHELPVTEAATVIRPPGPTAPPIDWITWIIGILSSWMAVPIFSGAALLYAYQIQRDGSRIVYTAAEESSAATDPRRRVRNLQELNRSWWATVRVVAGINFLCGTFVAFVVIFQVSTINKPDFAELHHVFGCAACASLWATSQLSRFVLLRSICSRGRADAGSRFIRWTSQMESGVLASLMATEEGSSIGKPSDVAARGSESCRAVYLSKLGPNVFLSQWAPLEGSEPSFLCARPDFFVSHSWRDDPEDKYHALKVVVDRFEEEHGFEPSIWIDKYCIEQTSITESLRYLPVYVGASDKIILLIGPTYLSRLWCIWEMFVIHTTRTLHDALYLSIAPFKLDESFRRVTQEFTVNSAGCFDEKDKATITAMIDKFEQGGTHAFEAKIAQRGVKVVAEITGQRSKTYKAKGKRRRDVVAPLDGKHVA